jgi:peptide/histidine transporter 3/4
LEAHASQLHLWEPNNLTRPKIKEFSSTGIFSPCTLLMLISFSVIVYIQDNVGWGIGFGICVIANVIGLALLVLGKPFYRQVKPKGSPFTSLARVMVAAIRKRKTLGTSGSQDYYFGTTGVSKMEAGSSTKSFRYELL